jgi:hypothetical protein
MLRRTARIACLVVGLVATAGVAYRTLQDEDALNRERRSAANGIAAVAKAESLLLDLRASLHAYVAPGQGLPFWGKRAQGTLDEVKQSLADLDAIVTPVGGSLAESLDAVDQLSAAERRARTYVSRGETQEAGEVIFTEIRDLLAAATSQVQSVGAGLTREHDRRAAAVRQEQLALAASGIVVWIVIALLLFPTETTKPAVQDPAHWRSELKETLKRPIPVAPETPKVLEAPPTPQPLEAQVPLAALKEAAEICADLSSLTDPGALGGALARVSTLLNATGLIVWIASNDSSALSPVATHGFDPKLVSRIGKIARDSSNLTAAAFRENASKVSPVTATAPGALAVPMCSPTGPAGVLSVELRAGQPVDEPKVALAAIIAAQLATLAMPISAAQPEAEESKRAAIGQ